VPNERDQQWLLWQLHAKDNWHEELLAGHCFAKIIDYILTPKERQVLEYRIRLTEEGINGDEAIVIIAKDFKLDEGTIEQYCRDIRRKFRNGIDSHVGRYLRKQLRKK